MADLNIQQQQLAAKIEASSGVVEALAGADVTVRAFTDDFSFSPDFDILENPEASATLGQKPQCVVGKKGTINFGSFFRGHATPGMASPWDVYLRAAGCFGQVVQAYAAGIGAIGGGGDGFALAGDTFTFGAVGNENTGTVVVDYAGDGTPFIYTSAAAMTAADNVVFDDTDTGVAAAGTNNASYGYKYNPRSTGIEAATIQRAVKNALGTTNEDYLYRLRGAAGNFTVEYNALDALRFRGEYQGVKDFLGDGAFLSPESIVESVCSNLVKFVGATIMLDGETVKPNTVAFSTGNEIALDPDPTDVDSYDFARIVARAPEITLDPFRTQVNNGFDDWGKFEAGSNIPFVLKVGSVAGVIVELYAQNAQIVANDLGERSRRETAGLTLRINEGDWADHDWFFLFR